MSAGTKLGPYEILAALGAGGMGEVFRARDPRLEREVAIKVLPSSFSSDPDRLRRFEQEARAAGQLNHPNIVTVYDIGTHEGAPYVVSELLEGSTLRGRLKEGPLPVRKVVDFGGQIAHGLAAAHEKGIVHRDLKPENIFITRDERVKILDFGLARLTAPGVQAPASSLQEAATLDGAMATDPGMVLGTVGYMSPEQVRGEAADARSDIFAFGTVLYEMLSGARAFQRTTSVETMTAILREEPKELSTLKADVPPALERVVNHCLEKDAGLRFQSTRDLAFAMESASGVSASAMGVAPIAPVRAERSWLIRAVAVLGAVLGLAIAVWLGARLVRTTMPEFKQLTFRRGTILGARIASDGESVIYSAEWDGKAVQVFSAKPGSPGSTTLDFPAQTNLLAVSSSGELALLVRQTLESGFIYRGVLARAPATGGAPRELLENVQYADWLPDGNGLAVVRSRPRDYSLEFPMGTAVYKTRGWISHLRISPDGKWAAFIDHSLYSDSRGAIAVVDRAGQKKDLTGVFSTAFGLAWSPDGHEVWYTGSETGANQALHSVTLAGKDRVLLKIPGDLILHDVSRSGRLLLAREAARQGIAGLFPGDTSEQDLSWFDWSHLRDLTPDGKTILFEEEGEGAGPRYIVCLRNTDGSPAVQLGEGYAAGLSPDGKWVISEDFYQSPPRLVLLPVGPGEAKAIPTSAFTSGWGYWLPDSERLFVILEQADKPLRGYLYSLKDSSLRALTPPGFVPIGPRPTSPDGKWVAMRDAEGKAILYPIEGGEPRPLPGMTAQDFMGGWTADGRSVFVSQRSVSARVFRVNIATGARELWKEVAPGDPAGISGITPVLVTPDGRYYAYSYARALSDLFVVDGVK